MNPKRKYIHLYHSIILFSVLLFSCNNYQKPHPSDSTDGVNLRSSTLAKVTEVFNLPDSLQPKKIFIRTRPQPRTIKIPNKRGGSYTLINQGGKSTKILLEPPDKKLLPFLQNDKGEPIKDAAGRPIIMGSGGISHFTNYTTEHGLALDGIFSSCLDHEGNLWFGTQGGGVSKYDGYSFININTSQGLAQNLVTSIIEDSQYNLWFGTQGGGVSKYDGRSFTNFTTADGLANNSVYGITEDKEGYLWFATLGGGVSRYDPHAVKHHESSFTSFTTTDGLAHNTVYSVFADKAGNIWCGTLNGVSRYNHQAQANAGTPFTNFTTEEGLPFNYVRSIMEDKEGNIWFGTFGGGISRYNPKLIGSVAFTNFTTAHGLAHNNVYSIIKDKNDNLWFATNGGISRYSNSTGQGSSVAPVSNEGIFTSFTTAQGLAYDQVRCITEDKAGNLWFGTDGGGVSKYEGESFTNYTIAQGLALSSIYCIYEDRRGDLWIGNMNGGGLYKYDLSTKPGGTSFTYFTTAQGLIHNNVRSILEDKYGSLWIGTAGGLSKYEPGSQNESDKGTFTNYTTAQGLIDDYVRTITEDHLGNLWLGTNGGVSKYDPVNASFTNYTMSQGLASDNIQISKEDNMGNLWFGTSGGGLSRFSSSYTQDSSQKPSGNSPVIVTNYSGIHGLASDLLHSITQDHIGNLWFGTSGGGLSRLDVNDIKKTGANPVLGLLPKFENFSTGLGLADDVVYDIVEDLQHNIIIGTNLGFTVIPAEVAASPFSSIKQFLEYYNTPHGYPVKDINQHAMLSDRKGITWAGTGSEKTGLVRFDYTSLKKNKTPPKVILQKLKVNGENLCWLDLQSGGKLLNQQDSSMARLQESLSYGKMLSQVERDSMIRRFSAIRFDSISRFNLLPIHLVLPNMHNNLTIEFNAVETGYPHQVNYQYMLEGYDKSWSPELRVTSATFGNINEGNYTFKVKARWANGIWSEPAQYSFRILAPTYRTWWAYLCYTLFFFLGLHQFNKWRIRKLTSEKLKLEKTVEERTEELIQKNIIVEKQKGEVEKEKQRSDELLLNILPEEVAEELKQSGYSQARQYNHVTVMFTDFVNFTGISERLSPTELVAEIHKHFTAFDSIIEHYGLEKIKTIGDAYLAVCGLPMETADHASRVLEAALEIRNYVIQSNSIFQIRIGIHSGQVVAGIVGVKKYAYDIWGDTVNTAARMEQNSEPGKINVSGITYELIKDKFRCLHRGIIEAKGKGDIDMYFVEHKY